MKYVRGPVIKDVEIDEDSITLHFSAGKLTLSDCGQNCCETRYMSTDDDVRSLIGQRFVCWEVKDGDYSGPADEYMQHDYMQHDVQFLEIQTEGGFVTLVNHNEHNGYYGGFTVKEEWHDQFGRDTDD